VLSSPFLLVIRVSGGTASEITQSHKGCGKVQDAYTMRCLPQVHGVVHDTIQFVYNILHTECNSATDNPMYVTERERKAHACAVALWDVRARWSCVSQPPDALSS